MQTFLSPWGWLMCLWTLPGSETLLHPLLFNTFSVCLFLSPPMPLADILAVLTLNTPHWFQQWPLFKSALCHLSFSLLTNAYHLLGSHQSSICLSHAIPWVRLYIFLLLHDCPLNLSGQPFANLTVPIYSSILLTHLDPSKWDPHTIVKLQ
jgi:hypothetical protein